MYVATNFFHFAGVHSPDIAELTVAAAGASSGSHTS
jgi:hypothetical protein